ncbi:MAG: ATP-binding protein [Mycoplasmataceae bacterium]|nr:ATP-binding protein [Mycoplasmataceae bacterium]
MKTENGIFIRRFETYGLKGINQILKFDFSPSKDRIHLENINFFGLERNKYDFGAMRTMFLIGQNSSGKSSAMESLYYMYKYFRDPISFRNLMSTPFTFLNNYTTNKNGKGISWFGEFVMKFKDYVYKFNYKFEKKTNSSISETLSFSKVSKNSKPSEDKKVFTSNEPTLNIEGYGIVEYLKGNASQSIDTNVNREILKNIFPEDHGAIIFFIRNAMHASMARDSTSKKAFGLHNIKGIPNKDTQNQLISLYKLFDNKVQNIETGPNGPLITYEIEKNDMQKISFNEFMSIISSGSSRMLELVKNIFLTISMPGSTLLIDEIDKSLHNSLSEFLVAFIIDHTKGQNIFSTHNLDLIFNKNSSIRRDQIFILKNTDDKICVTRGMEIAPTNKQDFKKEYLKKEFISGPNVNMRENLWEVFSEFEVD